MQVYRHVSGIDGLECTRDGLFRYKGKPKKVIYSYIINSRKATAKITIRYEGKNHYWQAAKLVAKTWKVGYNDDDYITYKIVVKNDSDKDYKFDSSNFNVSSDYIDYIVQTSI